MEGGVCGGRCGGVEVWVEAGVGIAYTKMHTHAKVNVFLGVVCWCEQRRGGRNGCLKERRDAFDGDKQQQQQQQQQ